MLQKLLIKNFAIIENTSLEFCQGFNVLIGETGAGKSIVLDALKFVLGAKAQREDIRNGENEIFVKATFVDVGQSTINKLKELDIECDDVLLISRTYNIDGKSSVKVNGEVVSVSMLREIGETLYDMFGQHDSIELLNIKNHLKLLDSFDNEMLVKDKENIKSLLSNLKSLQSQINEIGGTGEDRERTLDLLKYQIDEIKNANLSVGEDEQLDNQISKLSNAEKISSALNISLNSLNSAEISNALSSMSSILSYSPEISSAYDRLKSVEIELEDIEQSMQEVLSSLEFSEQDLDNLVLRQEQIKSLKRKYGSTIDEILTYLKNAETKYDNILNAESTLAKLDAEKQKVNSSLYDASLSLHEKRVKIAKALEKQVFQQLADLKMENTTFKVSFKPISESADNVYTVDGLDKVEFLFSANKGEAEKSLSKTISGGEMSRFMLAIKTVLGTKDDVKTLVFDEIDSGVSGEVGYKVGEKLYSLSTSSQVICITHLPQVTALADRHIYIHKEVENGKTKSCAKVLEKDDLIKYLSTLLGGYDSETSKLHAKELLDLASAKKGDLNK